jgi:hypothetical protein
MPVGAFPPRGGSLRDQQDILKRCPPRGSTIAIAIEPKVPLVTCAFVTRRRDKDLSTIDCSYIILEIKIIAFVIKKVIVKLAIYRNILNN